MDHLDSDSWQIEAAGFGINVASVNYAFAALTEIHDESWWQRFGGQILMNWEAGRILQYSTRDTAGHTTLIQEDAWSNEGVFALIQGLRRWSRQSLDGEVRLAEDAVGTRRAWAGSAGTTSGV